MGITLRAAAITACALSILGLGAQISGAQATDGVIGSYFPTQLVPGQTNVLHVAVGRNNPVRSIEITPSAGITVTGTTFRDLNQGSTWWQFTINVAQDAAPGPRALAVIRQTGRTAPARLMIPAHVPNISNLRVVSAQKNQPMIDVQFAVSNRDGTFGASPYVWFVLACGPSQPQTGVVWGTLVNGTVRASIPNPRAQAAQAGARAAGDHCDLELRATDSSGTDSNTITTAFDFK